MKTAWSLLPDRFEDGRHRAMEDGLRAAGWRVERGATASPDPGDALICWNLHGNREAVAAEFRRAGCPVFVAEEGYTRGLCPVKHFAVSLFAHNGAGVWPRGRGLDRWRALGIAVRPWRPSGQHILVCGQRGIGSSVMRSPEGWHDDVARRIGRATVRPIVVRPHPKPIGAAPDPALPPLEAQLAGAWACVVWSSSSAVKALVAGVPVIFEAPHMIAASACGRDLADIDAPPMPDREPAFADLAWAQWTMDELRSGYAFRELLSCQEPHACQERHA